LPVLSGLVFRLGLICATYAHCIGWRYSGFGMSITTEQLSQKNINHTIILAIDEIIREAKRLDVEIRKTKRTINRRF
jgi:hypothetical protein